MDILAAMKSRSSVRKYKDIEVPREIIREIVDCARLAPTGYNQQMWTFVAVTDKNIRVRIAECTAYGKFIKDAGACIAVFCDKNAATALEDACAATENIIIAAQALGLGSCWVNSHKKAHSENIKSLLNCPEHMELMTMVALGYPEGEPVKKQKKSLEEIIRWDTF